MTLIFKFFDIDKSCEEFVEVTNVPVTSLLMYFSGDSFRKLCTWVVDRVFNEDFPERLYLFYGVFCDRHSCRKLLCSYDYMDWAEASSID